MVLRSQRDNRCKKNCKRYADNSSCAHNKQIAGRTSVEQAIPITELLKMERDLRARGHMGNQ